MLNELLGVDPSLPIFHLVPFIVFGPFFFLVLYHMGLKHILKPPPEEKENRRLLKEEKKRLSAERTDKMNASGVAIRSQKRTPLQWGGQAVTYVMFALVVGYLSSSPPHQAHPVGNAEVRLSLTHPGQRKEKCVKRTREELQKLPPNMRKSMSCSRERWPLIAELLIDDKQVYFGSATPAGFSKDGHSSFYENFAVPEGKHRIVVRLRDAGGMEREDFDYQMDRDVSLVPGELLVIGFNNGADRLTLR